MKVAFGKCAKFFHTVYIDGVVDGSHLLDSVTSEDPRLVAAVVSPAATRSGPGRAGFGLQLLLSEDRFPDALPLTFRFAGMAPLTTTLGRIAAAALPRSGARLRARFEALLGDPGCRRVLDLGGRARSGVLRAEQYRDKEVVVLDVLADEGVDVVCDAHRMSEVLEGESFDAIYSLAVFEHLVMPWKVAIEMNRVMRVGAIGFIVTHQTVGMHDMPWDYLRFSDNAWKGLFNAATGFEILGVELSAPQHIVPMHYEARYADVEKTGGFEFSAVLVRKIGPTLLDWPLAAADVTADAYPA